MLVNKILPKYCSSEKMQIMYSNAPKQFILSREGLLYLREGNYTIHRYSDDPARCSMPYFDHPSSAEHANHLLKYNELYVKFTSDRNITSDYKEGKFHLSFIYCYKNLEDETILVELTLEDLLACEMVESKTELLTREQLEAFLYQVSTLKAKCIVHPYKGAMYLKSSSDSITLNSSFLDLSDEGITKLYNSSNHHLDIAKDISEVKRFVLTHLGYLNSLPYLVSVSDSQIEVFSLFITYIGHERFELTTRSFKIDESKIKGILCNHLNELKYPKEPNF